MIQPERIHTLTPPGNRPGRYVLYWMQAAQRAEWNHALEYAIRQANDRDLPVVVLFTLSDQFPEANLRHYTFMLEGLQEVGRSLEERGIPFILRRGFPVAEALDLAAEAALLVTDYGCLRIQKAWRRQVADSTPCPMTAVETDVIVPVETASEKEAYAASTFRPRIRRHLDRFLAPLAETPVRKAARDLKLQGVPIRQSIRVLLCPMHIDRSVPYVTTWEGGASRANKRLETFLSSHLRRYDQDRRDPGKDGASGLSPYLHFGQISPLFIALRVQAAGVPAKMKEAYLEELIVRRELAQNFVHYNDRYDNFDALPAWAKLTLHKHARDRRPYTYGLKELEEAATHDPCWNAAQREMVRTGRMHNTMRMYWGKKILEWSSDPEEAYRTALCLNNRHELDGRDPSGFAGVAWCFGKHDRPWAEREIFGTVRYMNEKGLRRKYDMDRYIRRVSDP